jgi:hypothetical protein
LHGHARFLLPGICPRRAESGARRYSLAARAWELNRHFARFPVFSGQSSANSALHDRGVR